MTDTIKEFLVALGWDIKEADQRRFIAAIEGATLKAKLFGDALEELGVKILEAAANVARGFDQMYFSAERNKIAVESMRALGYAAAQTGSSVSDASAAIENMGRMLRENRGNVQFMRMAGFDRNASGQIEYNRQLGEAFARLPNEQQEIIGHRLGYSESFIESLRHPDQFAKAIAEAIKSQTGSGLNAESWKSANDFMTEFRRLWMDIGNQSEGGLSRLLKGLTPIMKDFDDWLKAHGDEVTRWIDKLVDGLIAFIKVVEEKLKNLDWKAIDDRFEQFTKTISTMVNAVGGLTNAFEIFFGLWVGSKFLGAIAGMSRMAAVLGPLADIAAFLGLGYGAYKGAQFGATGGMDQGPSPGQGTAGGLGSTSGPVDGAQGLGINPSGSGTGFWPALRKRLPSWLGGSSGAAAGGASADHVPASGPVATGGNANFTQANAQALVSAAKELGTTPEDLATVIGYETAGSYSPSQWGGAGGRYMGLIQFGQKERDQFGVSASQSFPEQMKSVVSYLKTRGFKPGMGLLDLYSTINAGSPGHYNASDGNGTVTSHVERMQRERSAQARAFVSLAGGGYKDFGQLYKEGNLYGNEVSGATDKGAYVNGTWTPWWAHLQGSPENVGIRAPTGGATPGDVARDGAQGDTQIKQWEKMKASPWGSLNNYWGTPAPIGGNAAGGDNHVSANVTNTFHIDGANDPSIVAHMVASNQNRVTQDMTRNMIGATN